MNAEHQYANILEEYSDKSWDLPIENFELSGWSENPTMFDLRKAMISEDHTSLSKYKNSHRQAKTGQRATRQEERCPFIYKASSRPCQQLDKKAHFKASLLKGNRFMTRRPENYYQTVDNSNNLHITTIPLLKRDGNKRNKSMTSEKRPVKLQDYYDRSFLIVKRSPPTVSGYSVVFYHK